MDSSFVNVRNIRPGNTIIEDVFVNTNFPIIRKNTKITAIHIEVLEAFGVKEVKIAKLVIKRKEIVEDKNIQIVDPDEILEQLELEKEVIQEYYNKAVKDYKKEFNAWRAGIKPDIIKVRSIILPLLEKFSKEKKLLTMLNDFSDPENYLYHHSIAVGILASAICKEMGYSVGQTLQLGLAGVLADCGMAKIDLSIIKKAAFLTNEEFNEVKKHSLYSYQMVRDTPLLRQELKMAILQHHERLDGSGYPRGDNFEGITVFAQILAIADVYHAMTSERVYRTKESPFKVIEMLMEEEFGKFDIKVVQALYNLVGRLSIGTKVKLTNGKEGTVVFVHRDARLRPTIKLDEEATVLDLTTNRSLAVERVLD